MKDTRQCDCSRPWPEMVRLGIAGPERYFVCSRCGCIRHETAKGPGLIGDVSFHHVDDPMIPESVWREARRVMNPPVYNQLGLFDNE
jgi:hypothetical protein